MAALTLALVAMARLATTAAYEPNLFFDYDLGDTSCMYRYWPDYRDPPLVNVTMWDTVFSDTPSGSYEPGMVGKGSAAHIGSRPNEYFSFGSQAVLNFVGHGFKVTGSTNGSWSPVLVGSSRSVPIKLMLNGVQQQVSQPADNVLFQSTNVTFGWVSAIMSGPYLNVFVLNRTTIMTGIVAEADRTDIGSVPTRIERIVQNGAINSFFTKRGSWSVVDSIGGVGGQDKISFPHVVGSGDAQLTATLPRNVSFLVINGTTGPNYNEAFINVSPAPPMTPRSFSHTGTKDKWVAESIFHVTPLDPRLIYTLTLAPGANSTVAFSSIEMYSGVGTGNSASAFDELGTTAKNPVSKGAIAGGVVGGVLGLALLAALGFWLFRWYQRRTAPLRFERADDAQATPFIASPRQDSGTQPLFQSAAADKAALRPPQQVYAQPDFAASGSAAGPSWAAGSSSQSLTAVSPGASAPSATSPSVAGAAPADHDRMAEYKAQILTASTGRSSPSASEQSPIAPGGLPPGAAQR
ncbi:uncharacterized protein LOC62_03G003735 [Vanrija pseudolonga]|uniref:Peptidase A1 domain-containing protein n=1 Tax=Vanrija pseudolonga TaxID=143232 RepID=A0AAF0Y4M7_9TREE|nr:hypothetical protein LOC62_03G003735 [Vanrija pseudolonga]